jgi:CheY-like chemotaxis protein
LGLAMVRAIMERHGGKVAAHSRPMGGAAFSLWFPRSDGADAGRDPGPRAPLDPSPTNEPVAGPQGVLLVDGDQLVLATVREMLLRDGHEVLVAESGEAALALLRGGSSPFGVVISDWHMPGLDGPAIAAEAKLLDSRTATILLSGKIASGGTADVQFPACVDGLLGKPVWRSELRRALDRTRQSPQRRIHSTL